MARSIDINLPRNHKPRFPVRCVVCSTFGPSSHVRLTSGTIGWSVLLVHARGKPFAVKAPACKGCAWKLHAQRFLSTAATFVIVLAAIFLLWPLVRDYFPREYRTAAQVILGLGCLLPQFAFDIYFARPFDVTVFPKSVDYEFTSQDCAIEFALNNLHAEWVKINGRTFDPFGDIANRLDEPSPSA